MIFAKESLYIFSANTIHQKDFQVYEALITSPNGQMFMAVGDFQVFIVWKERTHLLTRGINSPCQTDPFSSAFQLCIASSNCPPD